MPKQTRVKMAVGERSWTMKDVLDLPVHSVEVGMRDVTVEESIVCGFRMGIVSATTKSGETVASVDSGGGVGSPWIHVEWKGKRVVIHAFDLLRAHVKRVAPEDLDEFEAMAAK